MDDLEINERLFNADIKKLEAAKSVKDLIRLTTYNRNPQYSQKFFNKKFKGNFLKAQQYVIRQAHIGFNNYIEAKLEESYH